MGCSASKHDCKEFMRKVELLVDKELTAEEEKRLLQDIDKCAHCFDELNLQEEYKKFIMERLERKCCHKEIIQTIREQLKKMEAS